MKQVKCPLCLGSGEISSIEDENWPDSLRHFKSKRFLEGFEVGYDRGYENRRASTIGRAYDNALSFKPGMIRLFKALQVNDETAEMIASQVCIEIGLHLPKGKK
jgi:hypothetical protein